jgi:hypothetical protein
LIVDPKIRIDDVVDPGILKSLWRRPIRRKFRAMRLPEFVLAHDALEWSWTEQQLDELIFQIGARVRSGAYRPDPVELVRAAKAVGLTRPLAFLSIRDGLLYRSIVSRAERRLLSGFPRWARFGRGDVEEDDPGTSTESGWFRAWLARQNHHWVMTGLYDWLVETDIANFFPYVDAVAVVRHTLAQGNLAEETARLLEFMLRAFSPMRSYRALQVAGLPQEPLDSSRILAHAYLEDVDAAFAQEGTDERYTRWMDDILIGASTREEALQQVRRVQEALEPLGLYPNTAKTRIISSASFVEDYLKDENDYLGDVDEALKSNSAVDVDVFHQRLRRHLRATPRRKAWGRVLRRYYSASRALEDPYLTHRWTADIRDSPDSVAHVLEYMTTFRLTEARFMEMRGMLKDFGGVYEDVELLCMEYLALAPILDDGHLRNLIGSWAVEIAEAAGTKRPRLAAAAMVVIGKHAGEPVISDFESLFWQRFRSDSIARQQAIPVLLGLGRLEAEDLVVLASGSGPDGAAQLRFLQLLVAGNRAAAGTVLGVAQPSRRQRPERSVIRPRALFLLPHLEKCFGARWMRTRASWLKELRNNSRRLRDRSAERWLLM